MKITKKTVMICKVLGLMLIFISWGADNFWKAKAELNYKKLEFITINEGIVRNSSDLQFLKYIIQDRKNPDLLASSYRTKLEALVASYALLKKYGANPPRELLKEAKALLQLSQNAYQNSISLEPKDTGRNIRLEIQALEAKLQQVFKSFVIKSKNMLKIAGKIFLGMYIFGSIFLICSVIFQYIVYKTEFTQKTKNK